MCSKHLDKSDDKCYDNIPTITNDNFNMINGFMTNFSK